MLYKHILIASGGAAHSRKAEERAVALAKTFESKLTLVSVARVSLSPTIIGGGLDAGIPITHAESPDDQIARQKDVLEDACQRCEKHGLRPETILKTGNAGEEVIRLAKEIECDLIVLGSRQLSILATITQGSVSDYVMRRAECDVLIARSG